MKICILGGAGDMAAAALPMLAREKDVESVVIADRNADKARGLAARYGERFTAAAVDARDHMALVRLLSGCDVALGYIGPFYLFEEPIIRAAAEAGTNYVSIADDYDAYLAARRAHWIAERAGITVITGLGNSPGITNLLARKGYESMEKPRRIHVNWTGGSDEAVGPANVKHVMHIFEGTTLQWQGGRQVRVRTGRGAKRVVFPAPIGEHTVFYTGHAESVSLPENLPGIDEVSLHGGAKPLWVARLATLFGDLRLTTTHARRERLAALLAPVMGLFKLGGTADRSVFRIDVHGEHGGRECHHWYAGVGPIAVITSAPCVLGGLMVGRGQIRKPGVWAAEAAIEPTPFLAELERRGVTLEYHECGQSGRKA